MACRPQVKEDSIYMKLFKNIPRSDLEMVFPNTRVRFRFFDKLRLGATAGGGLGLGAFGAAGKIALLATNPIAAAGALVGLGGIAFRQAVNFMNQKQRYMVVMAQNLYFHAMADNRGVMLKLAARAAEEDIKEEMLLYSVLTKERARRQDMPDIDAAIEQYLPPASASASTSTSPTRCERLIADGLVIEHPDGTLEDDAAEGSGAHIDTQMGRLPRRAARADQRRGHGVRRRRGAARPRHEAPAAAACARTIDMASTKLSVRTTDLVVAQAISDALEKLPIRALDAVTLFEDGAGAWRVEAYFASRAEARGRRRRALQRAIGRRLPTVELEDLPDLNWVAISQAALPPVIAGRFVVHGSHDRGRIPRGPRAILVDAGEAFGTAHHAHDARLPAGHRPADAPAALRAACSISAAARACWRSPRRAPARGASHRHRFRSHRRRGGARQCRRQRRAAASRPPARSASTHPWLRHAAPFDLIIANILAGPLRTLAGDVAQGRAPRRQRRSVGHPQPGGACGDRGLRRPRLCPRPAPADRRLVDADAAQAALTTVELCRLASCGQDRRSCELPPPPTRLNRLPCSRPSKANPSAAPPPSASRSCAG